MILRAAAAAAHLQAARERRSVIHMTVGADHFLAMGMCWQVPLFPGELLHVCKLLGRGARLLT